MIKLAPERGEERSYQQVQYTITLTCIIQTVLLNILLLQECQPLLLFEYRYVPKLLENHFSHSQLKFHQSITFTLVRIIRIFPPRIHEQKGTGSATLN